MPPKADRQILAETNAEALLWRAIEPVAASVDIYGTSERLDETLGSLTDGQRALVGVHWLVSEVCNGGFAQFFSNSTGILADEALRGLGRIGANVIAKILRHAMDVFPEGFVPANREARNQTLDALPEHEIDQSFEELERRFYEALPDLYETAARYVRTNPGEFVAAPSSGAA